jgi:hypothetical protein
MEDGAGPSSAMSPANAIVTCAEGDAAERPEAGDAAS